MRQSWPDLISYIVLITKIRDDNPEYILKSTIEKGIDTKSSRKKKWNNVACKLRQVSLVNGIISLFSSYWFTSKARMIQQSVFLMGFLSYFVHVYSSIKYLDLFLNTNFIPKKSRFLIKVYASWIGPLE
jgi:hypothetical protein